jgi:nitrite reductase/ring-hydroxylating ferredoxin subunit
MSVETFDLTRVLCRVADVEAHGARAFTVVGENWPLRGFVVRCGAALRGYVNRCPHAGHPLDLRPGSFLTADGALILCSSHGALFEKEAGFCIAGPCAGASLTPVELEVKSGYVLLADSVDVNALADAPR